MHLNQVSPDNSLSLSNAELHTIEVGKGTSVVAGKQPIEKNEAADVTDLFPVVGNSSSLAMIDVDD
jgi:hypothetical protein